MDARGRRDALARLVDKVADYRASPAILQPAELYLDLAGEDIAGRLVLTTAPDGTTKCLRPDFTLPLAAEYLASDQVGAPRTIAYFGPVFRQRDGKTIEFDQAGLEFLAAPDGEAAFDASLDFALEVAKIFNAPAPWVRLGAVDLFEAFLGGLEMPEVWRPRIRHRFGNKKAMASLLARLADGPQKTADDPYPADPDALTEQITARMHEGGLSGLSGRGADEIARRYMEKRELERATVPAATLDALERYFELAGDGENLVASIKALAADNRINLGQPLHRLAERLKGLGARREIKNVRFDPGFAPRLDYYTGHVFEFFDAASGAVWASGGRYDRLLARLGSPQKLGAQTELGAVGCSVWLDRLEAAGK